jgi:hypothetical protein
MAQNGDAPKQRHELVEKLGSALTALRATNDQMLRYGQEYVAPDRQCTRVDAHGTAQSSWSDDALSSVIGLFAARGAQQPPPAPAL